MDYRVLGTAMAAALSAAAMGQNVVTRRVDDGTTNHRSEVALGVSPANSDIIVTWHHHQNPPASNGIVNIHYNVSVDGQTFRNDPGAVPGAGGAATDPMVAFAQDGSGWVGSMASGFVPPRFWIAPKAAGQPYAGTAVVVQDQEVDKGVLVAGPPVGGGPDYHGLVYAWRPSPSGPTEVFRLRKMVSPPHVDSFPVGADLTGGQLLGNQGGPNSAVILRHTPLAPELEGRWVVAGHGVGAGGVNFIRPRATWGLGGANWANSVDPLRAAIPTQTTTEPISWFTGAPNPAESSHTALLPILPGGGPYVVNIPSMCVDPNDPRKMYMAFLGRTAGGSVNVPTDNIDLFIACSTDGGRNFSGDPDLFEEPGQRVLRLRDVEDLGDPAGSIQFLPAVTVDALGRVNVFYYVAWRGDGPPLPPPAPQPLDFWHYKIKMVSLPSFSLATPHPTVQTLDITNAWDMEDSAAVQYLHNGFGVLRRYFGDYIQAGSRGCTSIGGYVSRHEFTPSLGTYVSFVGGFCPDADVDQDGTLTGNDTTLFANFFLAGDPRADLNRDASLETGDVYRFLQSYSCACNPP